VLQSNPTDVLMQIKSVSTLQTGYHCVQASSQDKEQGVHLCAATCPTAPDLASLLRRAPTLPCVPWLWAPPPWRGGLRLCLMFHGSRLHLLIEVGSGATTSPQLQTPLPCKGGLRRFHVPHGSGLCLPEGRAPVPPCVPRLSVGRGPRE
jgi:hypothetical protein